MRPSGSMRTSHAVQRHAVVDAAAGRLAHAVGADHRDTRGRSSFSDLRRHRAAADQHGVEFGERRGGGGVGQRLVQLGGDQRGVAPAGAHRRYGRREVRRRRTGTTSSDRRACPQCTLRTSTCRPATWWAGNASSQVPGPPRRSWVAVGAGGQRGRGEHRALRVCRWCPTSTPRLRRRRRSPRRRAMTLSASRVWRVVIGRAPAAWRVRGRSERASSAGSSDSADGPDGTGTARRTAIPSPPRRLADRRAASPWRPGGRAPVRCPRGGQLVGDLGDQDADVDVVELAAVDQFLRDGLAPRRRSAAAAAARTVARGRGRERPRDTRR